MGISWKNKFAFLHMDVADFKASACDGINEAGLSVGALYLPGYTQYEEVSPLMHAYALSNLCFVGWALGNYATVAEVIAALPDVLVWGEPLVSQKSFMPLHYALHDSNGTSAVIEFVDGAARVYNNTVGVVTNSPTYDWHMQNLGNYIHLQPFDVESQQWLNGYITAPGQGSGLRGLPGDPTPPSRFISTAAALAFTDPAKTVEEALTLAQHLSNRVDIPRGLVRKRTWDGLVRSDYTQWTVFRDHTNRKLYYRTYDNLQLQVLQL
jgi:choloylglycine hydrolase